MIKATISKPCIPPEREISNNGNFQIYQTYSRGTHHELSHQSRDTRQQNQMRTTL